MYIYNYTDFNLIYTIRHNLYCKCVSLKLKICFGDIVRKECKKKRVIHSFFNMHYF